MGQKRGNRIQPQPQHSPEAPGQGRGCPLPVEALLDGVALVRHREALAGDVQGDVFCLRCTARREKRGGETTALGKALLGETRLG